ncbi:MAG: methyltransferase domain-containing protein [Candidatus Pacebacteria bacterium]|nr:methyltransferase domain-containing protein [Candidatus Paceibacterota bacterium]
MIDKAPSPQPHAPEKELSSAYTKLITDSGQLRRLLKGSDIVTNWSHRKEYVWSWWEKGRKPIAGIIDHLTDAEKETVSVFDYGCANGFLLRSLQEWSTHEIEPYGFDLKKERITAARELFPTQHKQFTNDKRELHTFPASFDFVYWNLWDNWKLRSEEQIHQLHELFNRVTPGGYLVVGLYDHRQAQRRGKLERLAELGFIPSGIEESSSGNETFAWFKRPAPLPPEPEIAVDNYR